jgi:hypothetical protein
MVIRFKRLGVNIRCVIAIIATIVIDAVVTIIIVNAIIVVIAVGQVVYPRCACVGSASTT